MGSKIKGIVIEIGGDTTGLDKALSGTNKNINATQGELKQVEKLLKLDPTNTELLQQKQKLLAKSVDDTSEKLKVLKTAESQAQKQFAEGKISEEQYRALKREIVATENSLESLATQAKTTNSSLKGIDSSNISAGAVAAGDLLASGIKSVASAAKDTVEQTRDYRREIGYLKTNAEESGESFEELEDKLNEVTAITNDNGAAIEGFSNLLQAGFSKDKLDTITNNLVGASIKWKDTLKFESLADGLQETLATGTATGAFGEMLERMGLNLEEFNAKLAECTTQAEKQDLVLNTLADSGLTEAKREYEKQNKSLIDNAKAQADLNSQLAIASEKLEPILTTVTQYVVKILEWTQKNPELTTTIIAIAVALGTVSAAIAVVNAAMAVSPVTWIILGIVAAVTALIAIIVLCVKHFEEIKAVASDVWEKIKYGGEVAFWGIKTAAITVINLIIKGINALVEGALAPINLLIEGLNAVPGVSVKKISFQIKEIDIPEMPKLALGGSVMVGEAGPEVLTHYGNRVQVTPLTGSGAAHALGGTLGDVVASITKLGRILLAGRAQDVYLGDKKVGKVIKPTVSSGLSSSTAARKRANGYA